MGLSPWRPACLVQSEEGVSGVVLTLLQQGCPGILKTGLPGRHQQLFFFFNHRQLKASYILYTSSIAGTPNSNGYFIIKLYVFCI